MTTLTTRKLIPTRDAGPRLTATLAIQERLVERLANRVAELLLIPLSQWPKQEGYVPTGACSWDSMREKAVEFVVLGPNRVEFRIVCEDWRPPMPWQVKGKARFLAHLLWDAESQLAEARRRLADHERLR